MCCVVNVGDAKIFVFTVIFSCGCIQTVIKRSRNAAQLTLFPRWSRPIWTTAWEQRKLGDCGTTYGGLTGKTKEDFGHGNAKFIPYTNVFDNPLTDTKRLEAVEIDSSQNRVAYGDAFFTVSSETPDEVGMSSVWLSEQEDVYLNSFCFGYRQDSTFDSHYLAYMLRSRSVRSNLTLLAQGISRFNISKNKVMELNVPVPSTVEQKQLGQYFTKLDSLITLHQRKCQYRGLYGYLSWEQRKLGELLLFQNGFNGSSESFGSGIPLISVMDVLDDEFITHETIRGKARLNYEEASRYCVEYGDVLFQRSSENQEDAGTSNVYLDQHVPSAFGGFVIRGKKIDEYNPIFIKYLLGSSFIRKQITHRAQGAQHINVSQDTLADVVLLMPSMREQEAVGLVFLHLANLITLHQ